ncbi:MAG: Rid family detoxifying hydrolase [Actinomycetota bacterium]|nr:Rid family detoxifying hydrolase [Actinomycetota bacterium]
MGKQVLDTPSAPKALGPYSVAVEGNGLVFISGQVAIDPQTGERGPDDVEAQASQVMQNLGAILADVGLGFDAVVKSTIFLADIADYPAVNAVYGSHFGDAPPARATVQAGALPGGFLVEIEMVAAR